MGTSKSPECAPSGPEKKAPVCEECDREMHPFAAEGHAGWACDGCGWSFDTDAPDGVKIW